MSLDKKRLRTSGQDGSVGRHGLPPCTATSKSQLNYRTIILRTFKNQVEWKSDNYGNKQTTPIQTGRRDRDVKWSGPHPHVVDKNLGGVSQEQGVQAPHQAPQPGVPVPGK